MKSAKRLLALAVGIWLCGLGESRFLHAATVDLPCTITLTGDASKEANGGCYLDSEAGGPLNGLRLGREPGLGGWKTNRIFFSFAPSDVLRNTNITAIQLRFNVL